MMHKTRRAIIAASEKHGIDVDTNAGGDFMQSKWPWKFLWSVVEKEMVILEKDEIKL